MKLYESAEDYLECILMIQKKNNYVRSIDVANEMNFTKASVSVAMKKLRENGYIVVDSKGYITLTPQGIDIANKTYERHVVITRALIALGVSEEVATTDACKIEHDISEETFNAIKKHIELKR